MLPSTDRAQSLVAARAVDVVKTFGSESTAVVALNHVSVDLHRGEFTAIMGPSGSGKSTLMHCLAGLDTVTSGSVAIGDVELRGLSDKKMTALRRDRIGFVFQSFNLVPTLNALENITLPSAIAGRTPDQAWLDGIIDTLGLRDRLTTDPASCPAASSSESPSAARSPASRRSCSATSPPATSTRAPVTRSCACCASRSTGWARPSWSSPTTRMPPATPTACCSSQTAASSTNSAPPPQTRYWTG